MTLVRSKPSGYGFHDKLTSAQAELIDSQLPFAIDGNGGGSYAPTAQISIGGAGLALTTALDLGGGAIVTSALGTIWTGAYIYQDATLTLGAGGGHNCAVTVANGSSITVASGGAVSLSAGATLNVANGAAIAFSAGGVISGSVSATGFWAFSAAATFLDDALFSTGHTATFQGTLSSTGTAALSGTTTIGGTPSLIAPLAFSGAGHIRPRVVTGTDANGTYGVNAADVVTCASLTADRTYTITSTGAGEGSPLWVTLGTGTGVHTLTLVRDDTSTIGTLHLTNLSANLSVLLVFRSGSWTIALPITNGFH